LSFEEVFLSKKFPNNLLFVCFYDGKAVWFSFLFKFDFWCLNKMMVQKEIKKDHQRKKMPSKESNFSLLILPW
jgi:hypothetical protein